MLTVIFVMAMAGEPGAPKSAREEGGKLVSRIEPRTLSRPPTGAATIPTKNPKAPLPPRRSQADAFEAFGNPPDANHGGGEAFEAIEPESLDDPALDNTRGVATIRRDHNHNHNDDMRATIRKPSPSMSGAEDAETAAVLPKDFSNALARLQQHRQSSPPRPSGPPSSHNHNNPPPSSGGWADALTQNNQQGSAPPPPASYSGSPPMSGAPMTHRIEAPHRVESPRRLMSAPAAVPEEIPSAKDLAKGVTRAVPITSSSSPSPAADPTLASSNGGGPSPLLQSLIIAPAPTSTTAPIHHLNLKPGSGTPLAPPRTPSPMAIVGGASLRINSPDKPMAVSPIRPQMPGSNAISNGNHELGPMAYQGKLVGSTPPAASPSRPPSRPPSANKSFPPPAGGPPQQYERAFRQWSSPAISQTEEPSGPLTGPVTFQVYTPRDIGSGRGPMRSLPMIDATATKKPSIGLRIALSLVGGFVVLLTAAAVIAVSTEEPRKPAPSATALPPPPPVVTVEAPPPPLTIGDPPIVDELPPTTAPSAAVPAATSKPKPKPKDVAPPTSLKQIAPPPNPYGKM